MLDDLIKSPENKIKNVSKILETTSFNVDKSLNILSKNLMETRNVEKRNSNLITKLLFSDEEKLSKQLTKKSIQQLQPSQVSQSREQQPTQRQPSPEQPSPTSGAPGTLFAAASANLTSGRRLSYNQDVTSLVSPQTSSKFTITGIYGEQRPSGKHKGLDISGPPGTFIALKVPCVVLGSNNRGDDGSNFGNWISVWVPSQNVQLLMGHCNAVFFGPGANIPAGKSFATLGSTGRSTGPHIHFQYSRSKTVFATDGPPNDYIPLLFLTRTKSEGFESQQSSINTPPRSRQGVLTTPPTSANKPSAMVVPQISPQQPSPTLIPVPQPVAIVPSNGVSLNKISALINYV